MEIALYTAEKVALQAGFKTFSIVPKDYIVTDNKRNIEIEEGSIVLVYKTSFIIGTANQPYQFKSSTSTQDTICPGVNTEITSFGTHRTEIKTSPDIGTYVLHCLLITKNT